MGKVILCSEKESSILTDALVYRKSVSVELMMNAIESYTDKVELATHVVSAMKAMFNSPEAVAVLILTRDAIVQTKVIPSSTRGFDHGKDKMSIAIGLLPEQMTLVDDILANLEHGLEIIDNGPGSDEQKLEDCICIVHEMVANNSLLIAAIALVHLLHIAMRVAVATHTTAALKALANEAMSMMDSKRNIEIDEDPDTDENIPNKTIH